MWKTLTLLTAAVLIGTTGIAPTIALAWYEGALQYRDLIVDSALIFAYHEKCSAGPIPTDVAKRAKDGLNMAGPSTAAGAKRDVAALVKKLGIKKFCDEYRREVAAKQNLIVTGDDERPDPAGPRPVPATGFIGQTGNDWAADCRVSDKESARYVSCMRYARGVADGFIIARELDEARVELQRQKGIDSTPTSVVCIPKMATSTQIVEVGLRHWGTANQETRSPRASQFLTDAWFKAWPCS
jgi:Rap1a immunity proteins